ncbi:hypothetical protein GUJ93_ZPchr0005g14363 [Zizania palustris]|uniref:GDSL esterase/lipase n=1 Tax=Zizania palustris TaxID=103762 RepID=A0A8J5VG23_ZIZPA|nr:hypothetical protein GUJ93_ZPchr0005g14363 [Zizania palustris]
MRRPPAAAVILVTAAAVICLGGAAEASSEFNYPAVFNFGDSNSDTGGRVAAGFESIAPPYGSTFFGSPSGRFCDGRLIIDFLPLDFGRSAGKEALFLDAVSSQLRELDRCSLHA